MRIRASSMSDLFDCGFRWYAKHVLGLKLPSSGAAYLGTSIHLGTAVYDQSRIDHKGLTLDDCIAPMIDKLYDKNADVDWEGESPKKAEPIAKSLLGKYIKEVSPQFEYVAVEAVCHSLTITDLDLELTGCTDRIYRASDGQLGICDMKTGKTAVSADGEVKTTGYKMQISLYELLAGSTLHQPISAPAHIIGLQTGKTDKAQRVGIGTIEGAKSALLGNEFENGYLAMAAKIIKSGDFPANPRSQVCSPKYCPAWAMCKWR